MVNSRPPDIQRVARGREPLDHYSIEPLTATDVAAHVLGALLNAAVTLSGLVFLALHTGLLRDGWPFVLFAIAAGTFIADFVSGLLH